jgi:hypothetical protein
MRGELREIMRQLDDLSDEQRALGEAQRELGAQQAELGRQQSGIRRRVSPACGKSLRPRSRAARRSGCATDGAARRRIAKCHAARGHSRLRAARRT